jgi:uncharacterized membrane protein YciS (DUF1049 family)
MQRATPQDTTGLFAFRCGFPQRSLPGAMSAVPFVTIPLEWHPFQEATALERTFMAEQNFRNHTKIFPLFHFFVLPVMLLNLGWSIYLFIASKFSASAVVSVIVALGLLLGFLCARMMVVKVQDRVIRLEERLRFEKVLPADLQARIHEFTIDQLVALRFASNSELPELARKVLDEKLNNRKAIKQMIKTWRPDFLRA